MADLINHNNGTWKPDLVRSIYPYPISEDIMSNTSQELDQFRINCFGSIQIQGFSRWEMLISCFRMIPLYLFQTTIILPPSQQIFGISFGRWNSLWRLGILFGNLCITVSLLSWPLQREALQTPVPALYAIRMRNPHHIFSCIVPLLELCGTTLAIQTSELRNISVQNWIRNLLNRHKRLDEVSMQYLQSVFTTLWTLWNHRNMVVHEGIQPNPIEVILTAQNLSCRYQNIFTNAIQPNQ